jgi:hypothetical protein
METIDKNKEEHRRCMDSDEGTDERTTKQGNLEREEVNREGGTQKRGEGGK